MGKWLEGKTLALKIQDEVREEVAFFHRTRNETPGLTAILVGENRASQVYVKTKERASQKLGIRSEVLHFPEDMKPAELKAKIAELNTRQDVDGILVQLPLPSSFQTQEIITCIDPQKDVDGFHPLNLGNLLMNQEGLKPCTPMGIMELLAFNRIGIEGKRVAIIGRSLIVGKPLAAMMTNRNGTVTLCHTQTKDLPQVAAEAVILVAAIGKPAFVTPEFVRDGATVVDVGMNQLTDRKMAEELFGQDEVRKKDFAEKGYTLVGDVHPRVFEKVGHLTPVPGGVGPLTVAMLMRNCLEAFKTRRKL